MGIVWTCRECFVENIPEQDMAFGICSYCVETMRRRINTLEKENIALKQENSELANEVAVRMDANLHGPKHNVKLPGDYGDDAAKDAENSPVPVA